MKTAKEKRTSTQVLLDRIISWEKDLNEYLSLESIINEQFIIFERGRNEDGSSILNVNENIYLRSEVNRLKEAIQCALVLIVNKPDEETKMAYDHLDDTLYSSTDKPKT